MIHDLKTWPEPFAAILDGTKTHEIRVADRPFAVGDVLRLREWEPREWDANASAASGLSHHRGYTGRSIDVEVAYLSSGGSWGLPESMCVMSIRRIGVARHGDGVSPGVHRFDNVVDGITYCSRCGWWEGAATPTCEGRARR